MGGLRGHLAGRGGFSFIETMVATALLAFIVGDVALVTMLASRKSGDAQRLTVAVSLAENALEHERNVDFNNLDLPANPNTDCFSLAGASVACAGPYFYSRVRTVAPLPGGTLLSAARSADIDVAVSWADTHGATQKYRLVTVISRY